MVDSDDDYEVVQCEEIYYSDDSKDPLSTASSSKLRAKTVKTEKTKKTEESFISNVEFDLLPDAKKLQYIRRPTRPVRLFSFVDRDLIERFSNTDEASKSLAMKLLNIVKSVNMNRPVRVENGSIIPSFYIMATYCDRKENQKITKLKSADIVNMIKDIIHMIKIGIYRHVDFIDIICDSPAIFLIKYIHMPGWDENVNAVYVVTSEYLLPYLCKIRAAEAQEAKPMRPSPKIPKNKIKLKENEAKSKSTVEVKKEQLSPAAKRKKTEVEPKSSNATSMEDDHEMIKSVLSKYLDDNAVQFFLLQMRRSGKKKHQFRWTVDDKVLCSKLMKQNPKEYNILVQKYNLPSEKIMLIFNNKLKFENIRK